MPVFNLAKNCTYYWAFGAYVSYFVNHPLYTSPDPMYSLALFALAMVCQASNFRWVRRIWPPFQVATSICTESRHSSACAWQRSGREWLCTAGGVRCVCGGRCGT